MSAQMRAERLKLYSRAARARKVRAAIVVVAVGERAIIRKRQPESRTNKHSNRINNIIIIISTGGVIIRRRRAPTESAAYLAGRPTARAELVLKLSHCLTCERA